MQALIQLCAWALLGSIVAAFEPDFPNLVQRQSSGNVSQSCSLDQSKAPGNLTFCGNSTLFSVWRPKARFIAPEGWMNDPQGLFQRSDGSIHAGYQCHPQHYTWGNISQCAATSTDFVHWEDMNSWQNPKTLWPSEVYDIRGVFDGSIIIDGWQGYPTTIYTSTFPGPLGATSSPPEMPGAETQSIAYTTDGGKSWIKLAYGTEGNPVIYEWPMMNQTGFRDPYAFLSPTLAALTANSTNATGDHFLTISGGVRTDADPSGGPRLFLYRQTKSNDVRGWTYLGPLVTVSAQSTFSSAGWSGNFGINFETASVFRLDEKGDATNSKASTAVNFIGFGTEEGRNGSHEDHWPLWASATYTASSNGSVSADIIAVGVVDWGRVYAAVAFPVKGSRTVLVGWTYEDDEALILTAQRGYQGAFTLFRDLYVKVIHNVDPSTSDLNSAASWTVRNETDGSKSVVTLGQKIVPEITTAYKSKSKVSTPKSQVMNGSQEYTPFTAQPTGRYYALQGNLRWSASGDNSTMPKAGFRVLASDKEWTDIYFDPANETLVIERGNSSLVPSYGTDTEYGKLRLWNIMNGNSSTMQSLNLTVIVDNSVVEVYANDVTVITTRVYPWLSSSKGAGFLVRSAGGNGNTTVSYSGLELWDGLLNAWPSRPADTRLPLIWDGSISGIWGLWNGF